MNDDLISLALDLLSRDVDDPSMVRVRKAISAAYYALFHALARSNADALVPDRADGASWVRVYRALDHATAKRVLTQVRSAQSTRDLTYFAGVFVAMQEKRHAADYDPEAALDLEATSLLVILAREADRRFALVPGPVRLDLATPFLFKARL